LDAERIGFDVFCRWFGVVQANNLLYWSTGYGDLTDIAFANTNGNYSRVTLTATSGNLVTINSFDLGGWPASNLTADRIRILDSAGTVLWNQDGTTVIGSSGHSRYAPAIRGAALTLEYGANWNIGLDNLNFTQSAVSEPMTIVGLSLGTLLLRRRRKS
jgi:hypothetical protein